MGPGPSDVPDRVLRALGAATIGHLDPVYLQIMDETRRMLQAVFQTQNDLTMAVSGTGSAGMEAAIVNLIEPGDEMIVCINGVFGMRMQDVAARTGAVVHAVETDWGNSVDPDAVQQSLKAYPNTKLVGVVHAETSTGAVSPIQEISRVVHDANALLLVDVVTSLGGMDVRVDDWRIDACYSGTQKCLSCPPGLAPMTFSHAAVQAMEARKSKVQSWYLDMAMLRQYWGSDRVYHHTAPINMTYALHEALQIILEEGLPERIERHAMNHQALRRGLEAMGLSYIAQHSLPTLNAVRIPDGIDDAVVRQRLLEDYEIEIGGGLGPFKGQAWRIGLMGSSSTKRNVMLCLSALESILIHLGANIDTGAALAAASGSYETKIV